MEYFKIWDYHDRNLFLAPATLAYKTYRSERYLLIRPTAVYVKPDERLWGGDLILLNGALHIVLSDGRVVSPQGVPAVVLGHESHQALGRNLIELEPAEYEHWGIPTRWRCSPPLELHDVA